MLNVEVAYEPNIRVGTEPVSQAPADFTVEIFLPDDIESAIEADLEYVHTQPRLKRVRGRDPGSYIGNMGRDFLPQGGEGLGALHGGKLDAAARARRALKNARNRSNRIARSEANRRFGNRA